LQESGASQGSLTLFHLSSHLVEIVASSSSSQLSQGELEKLMDIECSIAEIASSNGCSRPVCFGFNVEMSKAKCKVQNGDT
jgi:hypothetical protein